MKKQSSILGQNKLLILSLVVLTPFVYKRMRQDHTLYLYHHPQSAIMKRAKFVPSFFMPNGHFQTILNPFYGMWLKKKNAIKFERELFKFKDEGTIALDWVDTKPNPESLTKKPIVAIVPGLTSDNDEIYVTNLLIEAKMRGYEPVVVNYRGASGMSLTSPKLYCASSQDDLREALEHIRQNYCGINSHKHFSEEHPRSRPKHIFVIGSSMGANIVANYLGEDSSKCSMTAAVCIQPPMKIWIFSDNIQHQLYGLYDKAIAANLKMKFRHFSPALKQRYQDEFQIDLDKEIENVKSSIDLDKVTAKVFGYTSCSDYQQRASCIHKLPMIKTPTFIMMSKDDPLLGGEQSIDYEVCQKNPYLLLGVTQNGGHLGYFENVLSTDQWHVKPVFDYLDTFR
eukprot:403335394